MAYLAEMSGYVDGHRWLSWLRWVAMLAAIGGSFWEDWFLSWGKMGSYIWGDGCCWRWVTMLTEMGGFLVEMLAKLWEMLNGLNWVTKIDGA